MSASKKDYLRNWRKLNKSVLEEARDESADERQQNCAQPQEEAVRDSFHISVTVVVVYLWKEIWKLSRTIHLSIGPIVQATASLLIHPPIKETSQESWHPGV